MRCIYSLFSINCRSSRKTFIVPGICDKLIDILKQCTNRMSPNHGLWREVGGVSGCNFSFRQARLVYPLNLHAFESYNPVTKA